MVETDAVSGENATAGSQPFVMLRDRQWTYEALVARRPTEG
jgi:hypothetical protein